MRPERSSRRLSGITQSKAKMYEYNVPAEHHIQIPPGDDPARLFVLTIGLLGDLAAHTNRNGADVRDVDELRDNVRFSARFLDAYLESRLNQELDPYLLLMGSAAYYLCDLPGSSEVLAKRFPVDDCPDLGCRGLESLLLRLLKRDVDAEREDINGPYLDYSQALSGAFTEYCRNGTGADQLLQAASQLRSVAYENGSPRELLFADVICAIVRRRYENSSWYCLPRYSGLPADDWREVIQKGTFVPELWPAQHLLGRNGIFRGQSAVVQMPTSAGKTRATEIIIRSSFLSGRTTLAVIVAPFRALCHEIRNSLTKAFHGEPVNIDELSDTLQADFGVDELLARQQIIVVTPEKLVYTLRRNPQLAEHIGLLVYDEGHQFDSGTRGITYELLVTSLKMMVPDDAQTVLISAVINNAHSVGGWLNGEGSQVVRGTALSPTYRTVAFASWQYVLGRLWFVDPDDPDTQQFFVPRVIEQYQLELRGQERRPRVFPDRADAKSVALYLGLRLVHNGTVAVFCGTKRTASGLCGDIADKFSRGLSMDRPAAFSNIEEIRKLHLLHRRNLGDDTPATQSAELGVFAHHGNTPHGLRLAIEHALKEGLARFVICTSTLAQGVNLPIKYLIVTGVYQGQDEIRVRDFHNLIGRAGRSRMHTEGTIVFADPAIYDRRRARAERWRWLQVRRLLDPENSEPCVSSLLSIFEPLHNERPGPLRREIATSPLRLARMYVDRPQRLARIPRRIAQLYSESGFTEDGLRNQLSRKIAIISAIESHLMAHWDETETGLQQDDVTELAEGTLAYSLSEDGARENIVELFRLLSRHVEQCVPQGPRRRVFARTLYGVRDALAVETFVSQNMERLAACSDQDAMLSLLWPVLVECTQNAAFRKCNPHKVLIEVAVGWISGHPFHELLDLLVDANARIGGGTRPRRPKIDHVVDICENALAFEGTLVISAVTELVELMQPENHEVVLWNLRELQKRLRYGLPASAIVFYEMGFSDRVVAQDLSDVVNAAFRNRTPMLRAIKQQERQVREALGRYPSYFMQRLDDLLS